VRAGRTIDGFPFHVQPVQEPAIAGRDLVFVLVHDAEVNITGGELLYRFFSESQETWLSDSVSFTRLHHVHTATVRGYQVTRAGIGTVLGLLSKGSRRMIRRTAPWATRSTCQ
jgi:hypothetical protein